MISHKATKGRSTARSQSYGATVVREYIDRANLQRMGITQNLDDLPATRVYALLAVDAKWLEIESKKAKAKGK